MCDGAGSGMDLSVIDLGLWFLMKEPCGMYMSFKRGVVRGFCSSVSFIFLVFYVCFKALERMSWWFAHMEPCVK